MQTKTIFKCQFCGYQSPKWLGRCPECGNWSTLAEEPVVSGSENEKYFRQEGMMPVSLPRRLSEIKTDTFLRTSTRIGELDRVLGGGLVEGAVILVGGEPGIGKSTLMLKASGIIGSEKKVLYISGEESLSQMKMRSERIGLISENLFLINETDLNRIIGYMREFKPYMVIVDSVQTIYNPLFQQSAGTVTQIRESALSLAKEAKSSGICLFLIGHITKEGIIAGPKILEHIVDSVIYFEGQRESHFRIIRSVKNRFGATDEIGIFSMDSDGLKEVINPSSIFISQSSGPVPGASLTAASEGTRILIVEIQALVHESGFGVSRQKSMGFDPNRMALLIAGLGKNLGVNFAGQDVFLNVIGGVRINEPASDLAACVSIYSSFKEKPTRKDTVFIGEVGLCSEVRSVSYPANRVNEARRMGYKRIIMPSSDIEAVSRIKGIELTGVGTVRQAAEYAFI
jgi:DNA repair protein RadA/Sms